MKKLLSSWMACLLLCMLLCSCKATAAVTYSVETGDNIKIVLDTSDGYTLNEQAPFVVSLSGVTMATGVFLTMDSYKFYLSAIQEGGDSIKILEEGSRGENDYVFYRCEGETSTEYDFLIQVKDSQTGILLGCATTQDMAQACFEALTFSKVS